MNHGVAMRILIVLGACLLAGMRISPVASAASVATGDSRNVSQPTVPTTCASVVSTLSTPSGRTFAAGQENTPPDTGRIQSALNQCAGSGKAVELKAGGTNTA